MKEIKLKSGIYKINHFDYVSNGSSIFTVGKKHKTIEEVVPKKYWNDILLSEHTVVQCGFRHTLPTTIDLRKKENAYYIAMKRI